MHSRHCEEQRDEAVQACRTVPRAWIATPAKRPARDGDFSRWASPIHDFADPGADHPASACAAFCAAATIGAGKRKNSSVNSALAAATKESEAVRRSNAGSAGSK